MKLYNNIVDGINTLHEAANGIEQSIAALESYARP